MRTTIATAAATLLLLGGAGAATAAPPNAEYLDLDCDNGQSYTIWTSGNGPFTPGHLVGEPGVLLPLAFLGGGAVAVTPEGDIVEIEFGAADYKGNGAVAGHNPRPQTTCAYETTFTLPSEDPETGLPAGTVVTLYGDVLAQLPGR